MTAHYNKFGKTLSRVIKEAKRQHHCRLTEKADNKIKTTWNIIKHESGKLQQIEQISQVLINNEKVNNPQKVVDSFNTFSLKITENPELRQETGDDAISFLKNAFPIKFLHFKLIPTTETETGSKI
jgi:hypothetical protein